MKKLLSLLISIGGLIFLGACTGSSHPAVIVMVQPPSATVPLGGGQTFTANVTGTAITGVLWTIREGAAGGSIDSQGNYTAPQVSGTYHVVATSAADSTISGTAVITVPLVINVLPNPATVFLGAMQTFRATVTGANNMAVTWSVQEGAAGGSITSAGVYTAPQVPGTYHIIATSVADPTQSAPVPVTVPPISVTLIPNAATVFLGAMQTFMANVTATNMAVTWTVQEGAAGGSITSAGVYTAPNAVGTYHVIATSAADMTKTGIAPITVPPITVTVSPNPVILKQGAMQQFGAMVTATNPAVTWTIQEAPAGGTIDSQGNYTAPNVAGTYHVIATSVADMTKNGSATITVPPLAISISPTMDTLGPKGLRTFGATVTGTINTAVTWTIMEGAAGGTVDANGDYVAPTAQGTFHVVATSVSDPTKNATATLTVVASGFLPTGTMTTPRGEHTAMFLSTGEALVAGGINRFNFVLLTRTCVPIATNIADLFDPATGTFTATGSMTTARSGHTATVLQDNKVLVAGGSTLSPPTAEIYDPATAVFTATGNMVSARQFHTATSLPSGKVLLAGGSGGGASAELFDPTMGTFTATGSMTDSHSKHTATLLQTGKVLIAGGLDSNGTVSSAELYDPVAGTFTATGSMVAARNSHTATLLPDGTVLIAGGTNPEGNVLGTAEIYNPMTGMFTATGNMVAKHTEHTATLLPSGMVLIAGGGNFVAELFDPGTGTFTQTGSMLFSRIAHAAALLMPSGQVVVTGSLTGAFVFRGHCTGGATDSAELYH
ncbi:MAG: kelch repeat-containing protein [Candidatus Acidiferrales bacterium]